MFEGWFGGATQDLASSSFSDLPSTVGGSNFYADMFSNFGNSSAATDTILSSSLPEMANGLNADFAFNALSGTSLTEPSSFLNSFGDESKSLFGNLSDIAGSNAFKNLSSLGMTGAQYLNAKKQAKKSGAIQDEQHAAYKEDRAYNKARQARTSALRF
jgi:hypothetical protein